MRFNHATVEAINAALADGRAVETGVRSFEPPPADFKDEAAFQSEIMRLFKDAGWRAFHVHDSRRSPAGFPDTVAVSARRKRLIFAELKTEKGEATASQMNWIDDLIDCGHECYLWRPSMMKDIVRIINSEERP